MQSPSRRNLLKAAAVAPAAVVSGVVVAPIQLVRTASPPAEAYAPNYSEPAATSYLTPAERAFVDAAVARIIPADELGPGAKEAGVGVFIDRELAGPYGRAETWYMQGPFREGIDEQGYQLKLTPAQLYRVAIRDLDEFAKNKHGKVFADLGTGVQDQLLEALDKDELKLPNAPGRTFFEILVQNTIEGFLADPMYGGNRDFVGWKLIGFPGPRYNYVAEIDQYGKKYEMPFISIAGNDSDVRED